jgi:hypothetical protein
MDKPWTPSVQVADNPESCATGSDCNVSPRLNQHFLAKRQPHPPAWLPPARLAPGQDNLDRNFDQDA